MNPLSADALSTMSAAAASGREAWKRGAIEEAEKHFLDAWSALPDPKLEQDYGQSLSRGLTVFYRDTKQCEKAKQWLQTTREAYGPGPDDSIEFLAGTVHLDCGELDEAYRLFQPLFVKFGSRPFEGSDGKYLAFYRKRTKERH